MSALGDLAPYAMLVLVGFLPNEVWRMLGVVLARGLDENSQIIVFARAIATAILTGVVGKLVVGGVAIDCHRVVKRYRAIEAKAHAAADLDALAAVTLKSPLDR